MEISLSRSTEPGGEEQIRSSEGNQLLTLQWWGRSKSKATKPDWWLRGRVRWVKCMARHRCTCLVAGSRTSECLSLNAAQKQRESDPSRGFVQVLFLAAAEVTQLCCVRTGLEHRQLNCCRGWCLWPWHFTSTFRFNLSHSKGQSVFLKFLYYWDKRLFLQ